MSEQEKFDQAIERTMRESYKNRGLSEEEIDRLVASRFKHRIACRKAAAGRKRKAGVRENAISVLRTIHESIGGAWPLHEAFTDLDDHPDQDNDSGFNYNVGYVVGLCEAAGLDVTALCTEVEPEPPEEFFDDPNGAICPHCEERSDDPNHAANCGPEED